MTIRRDHQTDTRKPPMRRLTSTKTLEVKAVSRGHYIHAEKPDKVKAHSGTNTVAKILFDDAIRSEGAKQVFGTE